MSPNRWGKPDRESERTSFTTRFTPEAKSRLMALAQIRETNAYEIVEQGFWQLWNGLPESERESAEELLALVEWARAKVTQK